uniref:Putative secreted protein n=1 Tax=Ixodes ricinus TaxID=34613 RepID=A0A6B0UNC6_IXORI
MRGSRQARHALCAVGTLARTSNSRSPSDVSRAREPPAKAHAGRARARRRRPLAPSRAQQSKSAAKWKRLRFSSVRRPQAPSSCARGRPKSRPPGLLDMVDTSVRASSRSQKGPRRACDN